MAALTTTISAIGLAVSAASVGTGIYAQTKSASAQKDAEKARNSAMNLDAARRQRAVIREQQQQRAIALSNATNQGAGESSALSGAYGAIAGQANTNLAGIEEQRQLGNRIFSANRRAQSAATLGATAEGIGQLGGAMVKNAGTISSVGTYVGSYFGS